MAIRSNHYDAAFEEFLRGRRAPHVVVDEQRRSLLCDASLKSMDFIVYAADRVNLLVDVKGRRFPSGGDAQGGLGHKWENWATQDDLDSLAQWERVFGPGFRSTLVFAYHVLDPRWLPELHDPFPFRNRIYAFYGVWADDYREAMRTRSASWETVSLPSAQFRELRRPIAEFL
jgi:hypothetical protein